MPSLDRKPLHPWKFTSLDRKLPTPRPLSLGHNPVTLNRPQHLT
ncbi:hypothetical protein ISN45_At05g027800 [Arabidopsis thaliana x Arabidopsis arenosa]|uniref:Uncharacterized protein n=2 Tax=Arabidopsis TaxID=3701 RepID=A0A8T2DEN1_ARASU|nr:hypothetical protein ISN45_At05g027800 [Arabidopsis thaliana x Arabidopsis arenosa]KAG7610738.1 hypothetical protein ISN44_As05g027610 [Arabidopsis suecica]